MFVHCSACQCEIPTESRRAAFCQKPGVPLLRVLYDAGLPNQGRRPRVCPGLMMTVLVATGDGPAGVRLLGLLLPVCLKYPGAAVMDFG